MLTPQERKKYKEAETLKRLRERCEFVYANGKRCSMSRTALHDRLCAHHADDEDRDSHNHKFGSQIVRPGERLDNARAVNAYLTRVAVLAASSRITPKHAAILGYIGSLLVCTLAHIRKENEAAASQNDMEDQDAAPALDMNFLNMLREKVEQMPDLPPPPPRRDGFSVAHPSSAATPIESGSQSASTALSGNAPAPVHPASPPSNSTTQSRASAESEAEGDDLTPLDLGMLESMCEQLGVPVPPALANFNAGGNTKNGRGNGRGKPNGRARSA